MDLSQYIFLLTIYQFKFSSSNLHCHSKLKSMKVCFKVQTSKQINLSQLTSNTKCFKKREADKVQSCLAPMVESVQGASQAEILRELILNLKKSKGGLVLKTFYHFGPTVASYNFFEAFFPLHFLHPFTFSFLFIYFKTPISLERAFGQHRKGTTRIKAFYFFQTSKGHSGDHIATVMTTVATLPRGPQW